MIIHGKNNIGNVYSEDVEDDHIENYEKCMIMILLITFVDDDDIEYV